MGMAGTWSVTFSVIILYFMSGMSASYSSSSESSDYAPSLPYSLLENSSAHFAFLGTITRARPYSSPSFCGRVGGTGSSFCTGCSVGG